MNLNEHQMYRLTEAHREDLMRQMRLAQAAQNGSHPAHEAALVWLGNALVTLGTRLQATAERDQPAQPQAYRYSNSSS
jgi:hypothetical protein